VEIEPRGRLAFVDMIADEHEIDRILDEMTDASAHWLRQHPRAPSIVDVARYRREPKGENDYLLLPVSLGLYSEYEPYVDCEDLEIGVCAEARVRQGLTHAKPRKRQVSPRMWHIEADFGDGRIQDTTGMLLRRQGEM
jgi:hypothetical protein